MDANGNARVTNQRQSEENGERKNRVGNGLNIVLQMSKKLGIPQSRNRKMLRIPVPQSTGFETGEDHESSLRAPRRKIVHLCCSPVQP